MHFAKTYSHLLLTLPNELRDCAIEYRQLKKLIKELVAELESLGLTPEVLQDLLQSESVSGTGKEGKGRERALNEKANQQARIHPLLSVSLPSSVEQGATSPSPSRVVYELGDDQGRSGEILPRLRLWLREVAISSPTHATVRSPDEVDSDKESYSTDETNSDNDSTSSKADVFSSSPQADAISTARDDIIAMSPFRQYRQSDILWSLQESPFLKNQASWSLTSLACHGVDGSLSATATSDQNIPAKDDASRQVIIPLVSDTAFFRLLTNALESLSTALSRSQVDFKAQIDGLATAVSATSRPASARGKSDLYTWRSIFQVYMEAQVFEATSERDRGDHSIAVSEARLAQFARRVGEGGFKFQLQESRKTLERFLQLNVRILNLKKFQRANAEATRKILKKHAKRTALPHPTTASELIPALVLSKTTASIPHVLVVTLTESLMPVIPVIEDYICLICTSIAYKPIRLNCGHLFCVRCLVKLQKRGKGNCPLCRAPTVLVADGSNLDQALANFMIDWFPVETKRKAKENDLESTKEQMEEMGLDTRCILM